MDRTRFTGATARRVIVNVSALCAAILASAGVLAQTHPLSNIGGVTNSASTITTFAGGHACRCEWAHPGRRVVRRWA